MCVCIMWLFNVAWDFINAKLKMYIPQNTLVTIVPKLLLHVD